MRCYNVMLLGLVAGVMVSGILFDQSALAATAHKRVCEVEDVSRVPARCRPRDILLFAPITFGSEQLPVETAAWNCDFNSPIVWTRGAVACVFTDERRGATLAR